MENATLKVGESILTPNFPFNGKNYKGIAEGFMRKNNKLVKIACAEADFAFSKF